MPKEIYGPMNSEVVKIPAYDGTPPIHVVAINYTVESQIGMDRCRATITIDGDARLVGKMLEDMRRDRKWWRHAAHMDDVTCPHCTLDAMAAHTSDKYGDTQAAQASP